VTQALVRIEQVGPELAPGVAGTVTDIVHAAFGARPVLEPPSDATEETPETVAAALTRSGGLLAELDGRPVGALIFHPTDGSMLLRRVSVVPAAQSRGVAQALAAEAERVARARGFDRVHIVARAELPGTVRFWQKRGYAEVGRVGTDVTLAKALPVELAVPTAGEMRELGERLGRLLHPGDLVILTGDLGAGKTTLTQGIGAGLGVRGGVTSPTFVIARVHPSLAVGPALVHVDAYRLQGLAELDDLDLDVLLEESVTVVEWGEGLAESLAEDRLEVTVTRSTGEAVVAEEHRRVRVSPVGARWARSGVLGPLRTGFGPAVADPDGVVA
jgi:tRNA threonylcarbamoyladenosine biosynthesis protein TsaE